MKEEIRAQARELADQIVNARITDWPALLTRIENSPELKKELSKELSGRISSANSLADNLDWRREKESPGNDAAMLSS